MRWLLLGVASVVLVAALSQAQPSPRAGAQPAGSGASAPRLDRLGSGPAFIREHYTVEDGLPVNAVNDIAQSGDGYLWFATNDGLVRFDGVQFTVFRAGDRSELPSNRIEGLMTDAWGALWIADTYGSLVRYADGAFARVDRLGGRPGLTVNERLVLDPEGRVWVRTSRGLAHTTAAGDVVPAAIGSERLTPQSLFWEADGTLWIGAETGLYRRNPAGTLRRYASWSSVTDLYRGSDGVLLAESFPRTGLLITHRVEEAPSEGAWPRTGRAFLGERWSLEEDGTVWMLPTPTLLQREGQTVLETEQEIQVVLHDREGNTWVSAGDGVYRLRPSRIRVLGTPEGVFTDNLYSVLQTRSGAVWLGAYDNGLTRLAGGQATSYDVPTLSAVALHQDRAGALWVGGFGVCRIDAPDQGAECRSDGMAKGLRVEEDEYLDPVQAIFEDAAGRVWVGSSWALYQRPAGCRASDCWRRFANGRDPQATVRVVHEQADGTLWMGMRGRGILRVSGSQFDTLSVADGLPSGQIRAIHEDSRGVLWIGTEDAGLVRLDPRVTPDLRAMPLTSIRMADGLYDDGIHQILPDDEGRLWMNTNHGVFWVEHEALEAFHRGEARRVRSVSYTERDGMRDREGNGGMQPAGMRDADGRMWFPTQNGVAIFDRAEMTLADTPPPPVLIEHLAAGAERYPGRAGAASIRLGRATRDFEIAYTAPSFVDPENLRFAYRLEGFDEDWVSVGARRTAFYTNVPPGAYTFQVRVQDASGDWGAASAPLALSVAPFFYETSWFLALCLVGLGLALAGGYRVRVRRLTEREAELGALVDERTEELRAETEKTEAQAAQLRELDAAKSRFFANVSHEFRTPLTLTLGPLEDLRTGAYGPLSSDAVRQLDIALRNSRRLLRLVGQLLDVARIETGAVRLDLQRGDLGAYVRTLSQPFVAAAERNRVHFTTETPAAPLWVRLDPDQLDKVVANLLSNALKFTPAGGSIALTVGRDGDVATVAVRDTGPGLAPEVRARLFERFFQGEKSEMQPGTGIGLSLAKELAELHGGTLHVESTTGDPDGGPSGSVFTLRLPLAEPSGPTETSGGTVVAGGAARTASRPRPDEPNELDEMPDDDRTTVLVVDDSADIRAYVRGHLERDGRYRVVEADDGEAALAAVRHRLPDLIVSDVMMPKLDGFGLLGALRGDPDTDFVPVVLLTARAEAEDRLAGLGLGADDYVTKPFDAQELTQRIDNLIGMRRRLRERYAAPPAAPTEPPPETLVGPQIGVADQDFLDAVEAVTSDRLADESFDVSALAAAVAQSRSTLHRRLIDLTDESPSAYIRRRRLERGADLLRQRAGTVGEVAYAVGYKSVAHFSTSFSRHYGCTPTAWMGAHAVTGRQAEADGEGVPATSK